MCKSGLASGWKRCHGCRAMRGPERTPLIRGGMLHLATMMQVHRHAVRWRRRTREWAEYHPRTMRFLDRVGCLRFERGDMARGVAVGLFVALTPTVGFQTVLMLAFCMLLRGNFIAAFAVSWISNPLTLAPLYLGYYLLGEWIFEPLLHPFSLIAGGGIPDGILEAASFGLGSLIIALPVAAAGYVLSYWLAHAIALRRSS